MISAQFARPRGLLGRLVGRTMARLNAPLTRRVVASLRLAGDETVVEFGPGPGVVLPDGGSVGREYDTRLLPHLSGAGFTDLTAVWEPGGNGHELLVTGRRPTA